MTDLKDLIAKLESAAEGSRELSDEWLLAMGWEFCEPALTGPGCWWTPEGDELPTDARPHPTQDLQDTVDLVPEGWRVSQLGESASRRWHCEMIEREGMGHVPPSKGGAATPALALSAAIARAADTGDYSYSFPAEEDDKLEE